MDAPTIATLLVVGVALTSMMSPKQLGKKLTSEQTPGGHAQTRPTGPTQMHVDTPINTVGRNDAVGTTPEEVDHHMKQTYAKEAQVHPGVGLVAASAVA